MNAEAPKNTIDDLKAKFPPGSKVSFTMADEREVEGTISQYTSGETFVFHNKKTKYKTVFLEGATHLGTDEEVIKTIALNHLITAKIREKTADMIFDLGKHMGAIRSSISSSVRATASYKRGEDQTERIDSKIDTHLANIDDD